MTEGVLLAQVTVNPFERELGSASPAPPAHLLDVSAGMREAAGAWCRKAKQGDKIWSRKDTRMASLIQKNLKARGKTKEKS